MENFNIGRASYADGHLIPVKPGSTADPKPVAGKKGTQITVGVLQV